MEITEVKVFPVRDKKLRAFASIVLDASFMVNDIKVIQGKDGLFISMPSRRQKNGRFKDIAHPLNQETRQVLEDRILAEFRRVAEGGEVAPEPNVQVAPRRQEEGRRRQASQRPTEPVSRPQAAASASTAPAPGEPAEPPGGAEKNAAAEPAVEAAADESGEKSPAAEEKSLEEVAEAHLSDSYWTT